MYGAIIGDIVGSRFEFDRGERTKKFEFFTEDCKFTDDTVMTIAVADALIQSGKNADIDTIKSNLIGSMQGWAEVFPDAGYGGRFYHWLFKSKSKKPYGSYGNGSAMRVSSVGWLYDTLERTTEVARATAEVTHNHPEGVKGATCTAEVIFLARTGKSKKQIKEYVEKTYNYDFSETLKEMRERHDHVETCQDSMPKALKCFFEGKNYEDVVRNAVSLGGDTDTIAAIAGAMAEAYYGISIFMIVSSFCFIDTRFTNVLSAFDGILGRDNMYDPNYGRNIVIKETLLKFIETGKDDEFFNMADSIIIRMLEDGEVPVPMIDEENAMKDSLPNEIKIGEPFSLKSDVKLKVDLVNDRDNNYYYPLYTCPEEIYKGDAAPIHMNFTIESILKRALKDPDVQGVVINPFGVSQIISKELIKILLKKIEEIRNGKETE